MDDDDIDNDALDGATRVVLVVDRSHVGLDAVDWRGAHGAGGDAGLHLARVPERGAEVGDEPAPLLGLFALARRQGAKWLVIDNASGAVIPGLATYGEKGGA